jgi:Icc-related predicted phosphoesterase
MVARCFLVSDLHGRASRYEALVSAAIADRPDVIFMAGDLLPHRWSSLGRASSFIDRFRSCVDRVRSASGGSVPRIVVILGNDDERAAEPAFLDGDRRGDWDYIHQRTVAIGDLVVAGYSHVPPTPFLIKDWERYDVGRYVDPGCVAPDAGYRTVEVDPDVIDTQTIASDLDRLTADTDGRRLILLTHAPPYRTALDRADLDGQMIDHAPLDVHVGSVALRRIIESRQPLLTLHGHIHESARLTGSWRDRIGRTHCFTAAHDGPELALVRFDLDDLDSATRELI